jgi:hypothetical protein
LTLKKRPGPALRIMREKGNAYFHARPPFRVFGPRFAVGRATVSSACAAYTVERGRRYPSQTQVRG